VTSSPDTRMLTEYGIILFKSLYVCVCFWVKDYLIINYCIPNVKQEQVTRDTARNRVQGDNAQPHDQVVKFLYYLQYPKYYLP